MQISDTLSVVAILLAVIAFVVSVSQLLQASLATADGYRRCQKSVIGHWSQYRHRKFLWSEFRFEVRFETPHIQMGAWLGERFSVLKGQEHLVNSQSKELTASSEGQDKPERVCWLQFLKEVNALQHELVKNCMYLQSITDEEAKLDDLYQARERHFSDQSRNPVWAQSPSQVSPESEPIKTLRFATFKHMEQSWDFVPIDMLKPMAMIGVGDLAVIVLHLGMRWVKFKPADSELYAQGNGLSLTSSSLRSVGCVVNVNRYSTPKTPFQKEDLMIPTDAANAMNFGLVPTCPNKGFQEEYLDVGTTKALDRLMRNWDVLDECRQRVRDVQMQAYMWVFVDLIPLVAPFMRQRKSPIIRISAPLNRPTAHFYAPRARKKYFAKLEELILEIEKNHVGERTKMMKKIVSICREEPPKKLRWLKGSKHEPDYDLKATNSLDEAFLEETHKHWDMTEKYFRGDEGRAKNRPAFNPKDYSILVQVYINFHIIADQDAEKNFALKKRPHGMADRRSTETTRLCLDRVPKMWEKAIGLGYTGGIDDRKEIGEKENYPDFVEALMVMIFRGYCWSFCHHMVEGLPRVQSEYWESKMPIYIG